MAGCMRHPGAPADSLGTPVIAAAPNTALWVLGCTSTNNIYVWQPQGSIWNNIPGSGISMSVTADGTPWMVDSTFNIYEYQSTWQSVGPHGFSFYDPNTAVNQIYTGEVHDIDARPASGAVTIGTTAGGVWT
jgi:hypothetical protein